MARLAGNPKVTIQERDQKTASPAETQPDTEGDAEERAHPGAEPAAERERPKPRGSRKAWKIGVAALAATIALGALALLYPDDPAWKECAASEKTTTEAVIRSCGQVVNEGTRTQADLAVARRKRAKAFFAIGEIASAEQDYTEALKIFAQDATLYAERGIARLRNGLPQKAIEDFNAALAIDARLAEIFLARGNAYLALNQTEKATQDFSIALTMKPDFAEAAYRRALANVRMEQIVAAAGDYDRALELAPNRPNYWNARCWFRVTMSIDLDLALADCNAALKLDPAFIPAMDSRAFVLLRLGRLEEALSAYDAAIEAEPRYASPFFGRGLVKKRLGDQTGADADFSEARARQPDIEQEYANYGETP